MSQPPELRIVFEDAHVVVVDKPFGLPSQGTRDGALAHVVSRLEADRSYVGLHHRLDTPTSGLMVLTVSRDANAGLAAAFRERRVHRGYRTVVLGDPGAAGVWTEALDGKMSPVLWVSLMASAAVMVVGVVNLFGIEPLAAAAAATLVN